MIMRMGLAPSNKLRNTLNVRNIILTLASDGILITKTSNEADVSMFENDNVPALQSSRY